MTTLTTKSITPRIIKLFTKFRLPEPGEKVGFSDNLIKAGHSGTNCYEVISADGNRDRNTIRLHCGTVLYANEWKILPKETPVKC